MVRKKVDDRVRTLIENGVKARHRSLLVIVGDHGTSSSWCDAGRLAGWLVWVGWIDLIPAHIIAIY